jgi:hypothetical protein
MLDLSETWSQARASVLLNGIAILQSIDRNEEQEKVYQEFLKLYKENTKTKPEN